MSVSSTALLTQLQKQFLDEYGVLMESVLEQIQALISRYTDANGNVPLQYLETIQNEAQTIILDAYAPPYANDGYTPISPFARLMNQLILSTLIGVAEAHRKNIEASAPPDVVEWLSRPPSEPSRGRYPTPFSRSDVARFRPFWVRTDKRNGRTWKLSDRVWQTGLNARRDIGDYLAQGIAQGKSSTKMQSELRKLLLPHLNLDNSTAPYGTTVNFEAMRLARTEITRAHTDATALASSANPYVRGMDWKLSARHPKIDICDKHATIGMNGKRLKDPYPINSSYPRPVTDSHPQCLCTLVPYTPPPSEITAQIRATMKQYDRPPVQMPIDTRAFVLAMAGQELANQLLGV